MPTMTDNQIKAADAIIRDGSIGGSTAFTEILRQTIKEGLDVRDITDAAEYLESNGFIRIIASKDGKEYRLTEKGLRLQQDDKTILHLVEEEKQKAAKQLEKEERDNLHKDLQIQDLKFKVEKLNHAQYKSFADFWSRHWMTVSIALVSVLLTWLAFMLKK